MAKLVTVYVPKDEAEHITVTSLLDAEGIAYYSKNAASQNLFGVGQLGTGFNILAGQTEIQVPKPFEAKAKDILKKYLTQDENSEEFTIPQKCPACNASTDGKPACPECGLVFMPERNSE